MKLRLGWLNQPYLIIIAALAALAIAIAGQPDDPESPGETDRLVNHADRPDALTDFLIGRGWEDPPAPGDLTPIRSRGGERAFASPRAPR